MSKQIKQMEMEALKRQFQDVRDLVLLSRSGVNAQADNQMRQALRKKGIRLQVVKNSLTRRVFDELGIKVGEQWAGPTTLAWGAGSLAELSRALDELARKDKKIKFKGAVSEGQEIPFERALTMPTRAEAIAHVVGLALAPASRLVSQILAPGSQLLGQVKTLGEKKEEGPGPEGGAEPPPAGKV